VSVLAFLSGCAATQQIVWSKPGVTAAQGEKDLEDCAEIDREVKDAYRETVEAVARERGRHP